MFWEGCLEERKFRPLVSVAKVAKQPTVKPERREVSNTNGELKKVKSSCNLLVFIETILQKSNIVNLKHEIHLIILLIQSWSLIGKSKNTGIALNLDWLS